MVRDLWWKGFTEKVSFEFRLNEYRSDGQEKWRRGKWVEMCMKR